jgi:hypothetical protein
MRHDGGLLIALGAGLGLLVSIYNYFAGSAFLAPTASIDGSPAAILAVVATAILMVAGLVLAGRASHRGLIAFLMIGALVGILGTSLVAWLVDSHVLLALMLVCLLGWLLRAFTSRTHA